MISLATSIRERWPLFHDTVVGEKDVGRKTSGIFFLKRWVRGLGVRELVSFRGCVQVCGLFWNYLLRQVRLPWETGCLSKHFFVTD